MNVFDFITEEWNALSLGTKFLLGFSLIVVFAPGLATFLGVVVLAIMAALVIKKYFAES
jgi:hypothetical protein